MIRLLLLLIYLLIANIEKEESVSGFSSRVILDQEETIDKIKDDIDGL